MQIIRTTGTALVGCALAVQALPSLSLPAAFVGLSQYGQVLNGRVSECSLSGAELPSGVELTRPAGNQTPIRIVLGAGTQNYTCAGEDAVPVPNGAKATLFDASCLAASFPDLLHALPALVIELETPQIDFSLTLLNLFKNSMRLIQGHHFFRDATTPVFDFQTNGKGILAVSKKMENVPAPAGAPRGLYGAVDWLRLRTIEGSYGGVKDVYRVVTAGGAAPKSCMGRKGQFDVKYAAEYWFFN